MTRKLVMIHFHFEYTDAIEAILDRHGVADYIRYPMMEGKDRDGKHYGTQTFPGNVSVVHAQVEEGSVDALLTAMDKFRKHKPAHGHLDAIVLPIERRL
ncbi:PG0541 family transporter-associated protein [Phycisphaerales bacterium AB-hyl4]|uniref:PG0541 family transporter-associated protein n=1 Tax=Natronomicrosphaera hydrolytica TaxID=3242702 RepID=A0ABV4U6I5_9BACT